ncbi:MAG: VWA domain-containing protein [Planctomycetota bacterium]|nr:MAG: VWA domain-containing protein [Planctomycetota bacterium]
MNADLAISFGSPGWLWLLPALALVLLVRRVLMAVAHRRQRSLGADEPRLHRHGVGPRVLLHDVLVLCALAAMVLALASPRWGQADEERGESGITLVILLDCSRSMDATDLYPSRIDYAHFKIRDLVEMRPDLRLALVPFAGIATVRHPPTSDHLALGRMLEELRPELFLRQDQGTAIGSGISAALSLLESVDPASRAILLISDGDDPNEEELRRALSRARSMGVPIYSLIMGDPRQEVSLFLDGMERPMPVATATMEWVSAQSGGMSQLTTTDGSDLQAILNHMDRHLQASPWQTVYRNQAQGRYQLPLLLALISLSLGLLLIGLPRRSLALIVLLAWGGSASQGLMAAESPWPPSVWQELTLASALEEGSEARRRLAALLEQFPDFSAAHYALAKRLPETAQHRRRSHLQQASRSDDDGLAAAAFFALALLERHAGRLEAAFEAVSQGLERRDDDARLRILGQQLAEERAAALPLAATTRRRHQLADGRVGQPYALETLPGWPSQWQAEAVRISGLPAGMTLDERGLRGSPQRVGVYQLLLSVDNPEAPALLWQWRVLPPLALEGGELPLAVQGQVYRAELSMAAASTGDWQLQGLPPGLRGRAYGHRFHIWGIPEASGTFPLQLQYADRDGSRFAQELSLRVVADFAPDRQQLPPATAGHPYRHPLRVRGRPGNYQWQLAAEQPQPLPWLALSSGGLIEATPPRPGRVDLALHLAALGGESRSFSLSLPVVPPPQVPPQRLQLIQARGLRQVVTVADGTAPMDWERFSGSLPPGMEWRIDGEDTRRLILTGAPQEVGRWQLQLQVSDRWSATAMAQIEIIVAPAAAEDPPDLEPQLAAEDETGEGSEGDQGSDESAGEDAAGTGVAAAGAEEGEPDESQSGEESSPGDEGAEGDERAETGSDPGAEDPGADEPSPPQLGQQPGSAEDDDDEQREPGRAGADEPLAQDLPDDDVRGSGRDPSPPPAPVDPEALDAERWLETVLGEEGQSPYDALRRMLRRNAQGEPDRSQPW